MTNTNLLCVLLLIVGELALLLWGVRRAKRQAKAKRRARLLARLAR